MKSQTIKRYFIKTIHRIFKNYVFKKATNMINFLSFSKLKANGSCLMNKIRKKIFLLCSLLIISVSMLSVVYWLYPQDQQPQFKSTGQSSSTFNSAENSENSGPAHARDAAFNSTSQMDTEINCKLQFNASQKLVVNELTRDCFEYFISQYGERNIDEIRQNFQRYIAKGFQASEQQQIQGLWSRYLSYREQLSKLQMNQPAQESYQYFQTVFNAMHDLKQRFFSNTEIEGLFGSEDIYQQYTLDRMKILENNGLDVSAKAKQLQQRFEQLPQDWQDNLKDLSKLDDLHSLTAQIKARNGSAQELRDMRVNLVGEAATQRLEQLDQQRSDWKQRVQSYLDERKTIVDSNMSTSAKDQAIQQLKQKQFQSAQEQQRLQTFETIYDQGGTLPFSN